jgi:release factor glutamine methyltransferase
MRYRRRMPVTVAEALTLAEVELRAAGVPGPEIDARLLLAHVLGLTVPALRLEGRRLLPGPQAEAFRALVAARATRRPLQHLVGEVEFYGRPFAVEPGVLIPRPETERLVEIALRLLPEGARGLAADLGTGSGVIGLTLAAERPGLAVACIDLAPAALALTARNAAALGLADRVHLLRGDLAAAIAPATLDLVAANPPYVPAAAIAGLEPEVREHDPRAALDGGPDGLRVAVRVLAEAARVLRPGGHLVMEFGDGQADQVMGMAATHPFVAIERHADLAGWERVLSARRAPRPADHQCASAVVGK